jgi:nucleotide-binding universal stress UspA family protein
VYRSILVAVDGSKESDLALEAAVDLALGTNARLTLLHVSSTPPASLSTTPAGAAVAAELPEYHEKVLHEAVDKVPKDLPITTLLLEGNPAHTIVKAAGEREHDLIVIGSRGRGRASAALLGSVSHEVLHEAQVPVLVVHQNRH